MTVPARPARRHVLVHRHADVDVVTVPLTVSEGEAGGARVEGARRVDGDQEARGSPFPEEAARREQEHQSVELAEASALVPAVQGHGPHCVQLQGPAGWCFSAQSGF